MAIKLKDYIVGDFIQILEMNGEPEYTGKQGVITHIDDAGQLHGTWGSLAIIPNLDKVMILKQGGK